MAKKHKTSLSLREAALVIGKPINYYPRFTKAFGGHADAGVFASNFYYWDGKGADPEGWIYKTQRQIEEETGLGRYKQEGARKKLKALNLLEEKLKGNPATVHFKFDWDAVDQLLIKAYYGTVKELKIHIKQMQEEARLKEEQSVKKVRSTNYATPCIEVFDEKFLEWKKKQNIPSDMRKGITWTGKEIGGIKNIYTFFRTRLKKIGKEDNPENVAETLGKFLGFYIALSVAGFFHAQHFTPSYIYGNINKIYEKFEQHYVEYSETGKISSNNFKSKQSKQSHTFTGKDAQRVKDAVNWGSDSNC